MKLALTITHLDGVLYATCTGGRGTAQEILYHTQNAVNAAKRHQCDRVLIVVDTIAPLEFSFHHLSLAAGLLGALSPGTRVAFSRRGVEHQRESEPSVTAQRYTFVVGAARAYGVEARAFESIHDAREWLGLTALEAAREQQDSQPVQPAQPSTLRQARERRTALLAQAKQAP